LSTATHPHVVAHVDARHGIAPGETHRVRFDPARIVFFEPDAGGATIATAPH